MPEIFEDKYDQESPGQTYSQLNTPEQIKKGQFYLQRYNQLVIEMEKRQEEWLKLEKHYKCDRTIVDGRPNSFIPVTAPIVNGQIASMIDQNISANVKGKGYADDQIAHIGQMVADVIIKENKLKQKIKVGIKRYLLFGMGCFAMDFDPDMLDGFGMPVIRCPQITKVFIDGNIKDISDYQRAEYIIEEVGFQSIMWARSEFGDDIADYVQINNSNSDFDAEVNADEMYSFKYIKVWHRNNEYHNLQLLEMDGTGFVMRESDPETPYYDYVYNRYPFTFFGLYHEEGNFYRFGDGQLLKFVQDTINNLYDEIVTACKFSAQATTYVDPIAQLDPDDHDGDPSHVQFARNPNANIRTVQGQGLNQVVFDTVRDLMVQAAKITRFDPIMSGVAPQREITATQAGLQAQQGNTGIADKKGDVSFAISEALFYCMGMTMELWDSGRLMKVTEDPKAESMWVDARKLKNVPIMMPADEKFTKQWKINHPDTPEELIPKYMQYVPDEDIKNGDELIAKAGEGQTKNAEFDIEVSIGEGLPTSKIAVFNILQSLSQIQLYDENTKQMRPLISYQAFRDMVQNLLGLNIVEFMAENVQPSSQQKSPQPINASLVMENGTGVMG